MENQIINSMTIEIDEDNKIVQWLIEGKIIPRHIYRQLSLKTIFKEEYVKTIADLIVKSILYERHMTAYLQAGRKPGITEYDLLIIPKEEHTIIDVKRIEDE